MDRKTLISVLFAVGGAALVWWFIQQQQRATATATAALTAARRPTASTTVISSLSTPSTPAAGNKLDQIGGLVNAANKIACIFATGRAAERCKGA